MKSFGRSLAIVLGSGVAILAVGLFYDVLFAGIPYQDPTPELQARYAFHSRIARVVEVAGLAVAFGGTLVMIIWHAFARRARRDSSHP